MKFSVIQNNQESTIGGQVEMGTSANDSSADTPEERSKSIAAKLRQQRGVRDGVLPAGSYASRMPRLIGESTSDRNQRITTRYRELMAQNGGKSRGLPVQLAREFKLSPQYIRRDVIKPYRLEKSGSKRQ